MISEQTLKEKVIRISDLEVSYKTAGEGKPLLILHGWGSSSDSWVDVQNKIAEYGYRVVTVDLPGFGKTPAPKDAWGIEEYSNFVLEFANGIGLKRFALAGHSFGGQTAIQFTVTHPERVEKLILIASSGIRRTPGFAKKTVMFVAKGVGLLLYLVPFKDLRNNIRSVFYMAIRRKDYARAQGIMKEVFRKVITQDLTAKFPQLKVPVLVVWGQEDQMTPMQDAHLMGELIPRAQIKIFPQRGHSLNFEIPDELAKTMTKYLE